MEMEELAKKIDQIGERIRWFLSEETGKPSIGLMMAGIRSSLEDIVHHFKDGETKLDRAMNTLNEMKALMGENTANVRALRNKMFCAAGDAVVNKEIEGLSKESGNDTPPTK